MDEIVEGTAKPLDSDEMRAVLMRLMPKVHEQSEVAKSIRQRIANGENQVAKAKALPRQYSQADIDEAEAAIEALRQELRGHQAWEIVGLGMALARAVAAILAETRAEAGWQPPAGSVLRLVLPGLLNMGVDLTDGSFQKLT